MYIFINLSALYDHFLFLINHFLAYFFTFETTVQKKHFHLALNILFCAISTHLHILVLSAATTVPASDIP